MLYCVSNAACPIEYISCGNLVSENGFLHDRRTLDSWVFIVVQKGTLHIAQNEQKFDITENETLLLFPHQTHYGYKKSEGYLSYYWVHFYIKDPDYAIYSRNTLLRQNNFLYDMFPPPTKIRNLPANILFFRNAVIFLTKSVPLYSSVNCLICPNVTIIRLLGAAVMR